MFLRGMALAMVAMMLAAFTLQGSAIMKCSSSGKVFLAGWQNAECEAQTGCESIAVEDDCCCETHGEKAACGFDCCSLVGTLPENLVVQSEGFQIPTVPVSDLGPTEFPKVSDETSGSLLVHEIRDPDPPGNPLRVIYASFLI